MMEDLIRRQDAIKALNYVNKELIQNTALPEEVVSVVDRYVLLCMATISVKVPKAHPTLYGYDIETLKAITDTLTAKGLTPEAYADLITDTGRVVQMVLEEQRETLRKAVGGKHE